MQVSIISVSQPRVAGLESAEDLIAYTARVSNPGNQANTETAPRLLAYLVRNQHWSPFEMVSITMEIETTRDIARQMLRHRSFSFQEFSQRYAEVDAEPVFRECRLQDPTNRQNSIAEASMVHQVQWNLDQVEVWDLALKNYRYALQRGVAKEIARALLPEGLTQSRVYMAGSLRSWIHYVQLRAEAGTQREHRDIAEVAKARLLVEFPSLSEVLACSPT